ncbi:hypothetical protein N7530_004455 [Penicillium desertorum]|uniref:Uncharacterized protein n=1 Tax=Penicillium desertorum TaxID=1303715 RepID=A0A9W9WY95_9EURO|nr:hypothetical protein N7530_004455 [Penicillium desertorum]
MPVTGPNPQLPKQQHLPMWPRIHQRFRGVGVWRRRESRQSASGTCQAAGYSHCYRFSAHYIVALSVLCGYEKLNKQQGKGTAINE